MPALKSRTVVLGDATIVADGESAARVTVLQTTRATAPAARREVTLLGSARHLHILATIEILHRLLVCELQPRERHVLPVMWFEQVCVGVMETRPTQVGGGAESHMEVIPSIERAFTIEHCLLAPPLS